VEVVQLTSGKNSDSIAAPVTASTSAIEQYFAKFEQLIAFARDSFLAGDRDSSAAYIQAAGYYAWLHPTGLFASTELEELLTKIGSSLAPQPPAFSRTPQAPPKTVLHVLTEVHGLGGHTRLTWRWIEADPTRSHSVVLTSQGAPEVPAPLIQAAEATGGKVHFLDRGPGGLISRAQALRKLAANFDHVALHIHPYDVVPLIAFARREQRPPLSFLNHNDHVFWLGTTIADQVAEMRESGRQLSMSRRGISETRISMLPIPLEVKPELLERGEAKKQLGISLDAIVLLTIAGAYKYNAAEGQHFTDVLLPILQTHPRAQLLVIGPADTGVWATASQRSAGQLKVLGRRSDTALFYQAADIYLDSFPFSSLTAVLEAGGFAAPIVSYCARSAGAEILCGDDLALTKLILRGSNANEYARQITRLIENPKLRTELGQSTRESLIAYHAKGGWNEFLEKLYERSAESAQAEFAQGPHVPREVGELEAQLNEVFSISGLAADVSYILRNSVGFFPFKTRMKIWRDVFGSQPSLLPACLLSDWQKVGLKLLQQRITGQGHGNGAPAKPSGPPGSAPDPKLKRATSPGTT
jgi:glycosyltransferase involved in cell wall biosynthesis